MKRLLNLFVVFLLVLSASCQSGHRSEKPDSKDQAAIPPKSLLHNGQHSAMPVPASPAPSADPPAPNGGQPPGQAAAQPPAPSGSTPAPSAGPTPLTSAGQPPSPSASPSVSPQSGQRGQAAVKPGFTPDLLEIPSIGLKAVVTPVGILNNGQMDVPKQFDRVGLLALWTKPGDPGNAAIAGHFDHYTGPAVFYHLRKLKPGDQVIVSDKRGNRSTFVVRSVESFATAQAPLRRIFGKSDKRNLNLITCSGKFNRKTQEHAQRLVVFTELHDIPQP